MRDGKSAAAASLRSDSIWYVCTAAAVYRINSEYCREESTLTDQPSRQMAEALHGKFIPRVGSCLTGMAWIFLRTVSKRARFVSRSYVLPAARTGRRDEIAVEVEQGIFLHT